MKKVVSSKNDIQRIGLFSEVGYITIGDPYKPIIDRPFNDNAGRGKQMMSSYTKSKTGLIDGYFQSNFGRVFEKEGYADPIKQRRQERNKQTQKNIVGKAFYPSNATKKPSGLGSHYGTFAGAVDYFKGVTRPKEPYKSAGYLICIDTVTTYQLSAAAKPKYKFNFSVLGFFKLRSFKLKDIF